MLDSRWVVGSPRFALRSRQGVRQSESMKSIAFVVLILGVAIGVSAWPPAEKMSLNDVIAAHLASIGTPEARAAVTSRLAKGVVQRKLVQGGLGTLDGKAFLLSEGNKFRAAMPFTYADYWGEQLL